MNKIVCIIGCIMMGYYTASAQQDSLINKQSRATGKQEAPAIRNWSIHFQATVIPQAHLLFSAAYSGDKSMLTSESPKVSLTSTLFIGRKLWKHAALYFNPELSGGSGLSKAQGAAGFPNGETFRIGSTKPKLYLARLYLEQKFALSRESEQTEDNINQLANATPVKYLSLRAGKFSLSDFFDNNTYSHDPRTQFFNWSLMSAGAWDYPANTRGYTVGAVAEYHTPGYAIRAAVTQVPKEANGADLHALTSNDFGTVVEIEKTFPLSEKGQIVVRLAGFYNEANMGNYNDAVAKALPLTTPDITQTREDGRPKGGFYLNAEYKRDNGGYFIRLSKNDGKNETWVFTEIDRSVSAGISFNGSRWKRSNDQWGIAVVSNYLSKPHSRYLSAGGYGFIIGDGKLNYSAESIAEAYYSFSLAKKRLFVSPDYQFILHPAYNADRGPVHIFGVRFHVVI